MSTLWVVLIGLKYVGLKETSVVWECDLMFDAVYCMLVMES